MSIDPICKSLGVKANLAIRVLDAHTHQLVSEHIGHNQACNSMVSGIARYLCGTGSSNLSNMLCSYIPKYISLGTLGLLSQGSDSDGLPTGIGVGNLTDSEDIRFDKYMKQTPGYGADGYDVNHNNGRAYLGLGPKFADRASTDTINCELISDSFQRAEITYRQILPEAESELPETADVVFSAMISTGALAQFRPVGSNYVFITEVGLWGRRDWSNGYDNGLLAGYRIIPPNAANWQMKESELVSEEQAAANRLILKQNILKVGINQVVQVIWKVQIGSIKQFNQPIIVDAGAPACATFVSLEEGA